MTGGRGDVYARLTCRDLIEQYLADYVDGVLHRGVAVALERHLETCAPCVAYVDTYRKTRDLVRDTGRLDMDMPDDFLHAIRAFLLGRLGLEPPAGRRSTDTQ
jgi:hypothetical protein